MSKTKNTRVGFRCPAKLRAALECIAKADSRSMSQVICLLLANQLEACPGLSLSDEQVGEIIFESLGQN